MRLTLKLASLLCLLLAAISTLNLWLADRAQTRRLEEEQDSRLKAAVESLARHCAASRGRKDFASLCLAALDQTLALTEPSAFSEALVADTRSRVLLHSDFLKGDTSRRGAFASEISFRGRRAYSAPLAAPSGMAGTLIVLFDAEGLQLSIARSRAPWGRLLLALLLSLGLGSASAIYMVRRVLGPLEPLIEASHGVARGDFKRRVPEDQGDELGIVATAFNRMVRGLAELDELKEDFLAKVTHDLKNPLSVIVSQADLALGGREEAAARSRRESLAVIKKSATTLAGQIDEILDAARLEAGRANLEPELLDLLSEAGSAIDSFRPMADELGVSLSQNIQPGIGTVHADPKAFKRILANLIGNALRFTPAGGSVALHIHKGRPNELVFTVSDTGVGIPPHRLGEIFRKFSQVPETKDKARLRGGTGLGLVICKELVEAQGGRIWAESAPGDGARFHFTLPERPAPAPPGRPG